MTGMPNQVGDAGSSHVAQLFRGVSLKEREYSRNPHPPYCTCVQCTQARIQRQQRAAIGPLGPVVRLWRSIRRALGG